MSTVRQNFHQDSEDAINKQIDIELRASYVYTAMAFHFQRDDVALMGFHGEFRFRSEKKRQHGYKLMEYLNKRGGRIFLKNIAVPPKQSWTNPKEAMLDALNLEKEINKSLLSLHATASDHSDANLRDFLESNYLQEQVDEIKEIGDHITNLERVGNGLGVYMFDRKLNS